MSKEKNNERIALRFFEEDFSLSDIIKPEILKKFKEEFEVDEAIPINLAIGLKKDNNFNEIVSLTHQKPEDLIDRIVLVEINHRGSFDKVIKVLKE